MTPFPRRRLVQSRERPIAAHPSLVTVAVGLLATALTAVRMVAEEKLLVTTLQASSPASAAKDKSFQFIVVHSA